MELQGSNLKIWEKQGLLTSRRIPKQEKRIWIIIRSLQGL